MAIQKRTIHPQKLSVLDMVNNPTGKGSAYVYSRAKIKQQLNTEFIYLLRNYRKHFQCTPIIYPDDRILFVMKCPSSDYKHNKIVYDVLIEVPADKTRRPSLRPAKFFSNSMSFVFTYAYVFNQSDLLIDRFSKLLPQQCLVQYPSIRNPVGSLGYERSLYFCARYLLDGQCLSPSYIRKHGVKAIIGIDNRIKNQIADVNKLIAIYQHSKDLQVKNHRKPVDQTRRAERERMKQEYIQKREAMKKTREFKPARSKLNARRARRIVSQERK